MHNIKFIQRRFPDKANTIIAVLALLSFTALALGLGLLLLLNGS